MKKIYFSALIFCSLFGAAQTNGQMPEQILSPADNKQDFPVSFDSYIIGNIITLRWRAFRENNIDRYVLEHGSDSLHFNNVYEIAANGGDGFDYAYNDGDSYPMTQSNYYRIRVINKDGSYYYTPFIMADVRNANTPVIAPTVLHTGGMIRLVAPYKQPLTINFFSEGGTFKGSYTVRDAAFNINTTGWDQGVYIYRISDAQHPLVEAGKILVM